MLYAQLYELLAQQVLMLQTDPMQFLSYLQDTHFLLVQVQGSQPAASLHAHMAGGGPVEKVCCRIPRDVPAPASTQTAGTFVFIINEDVSRRSHLIYTLGQFTKPSPETGMILPEEKLLKRYIDSRKKEYLEFVKQNERQAAASASSAIEIKQTATRVTIEGDHVCLFLVKRVNAAQDVGQAMGGMEQP